MKIQISELEHGLRLITLNGQLDGNGVYAVEVDFIARAGAAFLEDAQLLVDAALNPGAADVNDVDTTRLDVGDEDFGSQVTRLVR